MKRIFGFLICVLMLVFTMFACGDGGSGSDGSNNTTSKPTAPQGFTVTPGVDANILAWNEVAGATSYTVYWSLSDITSDGVNITSSTNLSSSSTTSASYKHSGLTGGTSYHYVVTAMNGNGSGPASAEEIGTPLIATTPPVAPTNVEVTVGSLKNTISWTETADTKMYNVYWSTTSGFNTNNATRVPYATLPYEHADLTAGVTYYYVVTATNDAGESAASAEVSGTPTP